MIVAKFFFISGGRQLTSSSMSLTIRHLTHASASIGPGATTVLHITTSSSSTAPSLSDVGRTSNKAATKCSSDTSVADHVQAAIDDDLEDMFHDGPCGVEWNGPTRGGRRPEPTRYGDWERKGRVSDF